MIYNPYIKVRLTTEDKIEIAIDLINKGLAEDCLKSLSQDSEMYQIISDRLE